MYCPHCQSNPCICNHVQNGQKSLNGAKDNKTDLTDDEKRQVEKLEEIDRKVRAHEQAHMAAGAGLVRGGASFEYQVGPDGRQYAVGGEVSIDTSEVPDNPAATIKKMQQVKRAALAPAEPSGQDVQVAAQAGAKMAKAQQQLAKQNSEEMKNPEKPAADEGKKAGYNQKGEEVSAENVSPGHFINIAA